MQRGDRARFELTWHSAGLSAAGFCIAIGAGVCLLWVLRPETLAERMPVIFLMQFNTALCLVLTAIAFGAMLQGNPRLAIVLSVVVCIVGLAFALEPIVAPGHPLDALLIVPFRQTSAQPGHVMLATALSFFFVGLCVLIGTVTGEGTDTGRAKPLPASGATRPSPDWTTRFATSLRVCLAAIVFMAACATLMGYGLHLATGSDWLRYTHMSPHTALCFAALTLPMIFLRVEELGYDRSTIAATLGATSYLLLLLLSLLGLQDEFEGDVAGAGERLEPHAVLVGLLIFSGIIYAGLIVYAFRNAQRYRLMAAELSESRQRLAAVIDTAADGIITIDSAGKILSANRAAESIFDYRGYELIQRNIRTLFPGLDLDLAQGLASEDTDVSCPDLIAAHRADEMEGVRRNGHGFPAELSLARMDVGPAVLFSLIVRDISQRRQHERDIFEANAELEQFSYRTSHDLRAPVASSLGLTRILNEMIGSGASGGEMAPVIDRMASGLQRLDRLIENIIELKRSRLLDEPTVTVRVADAVRETIERVGAIDTSGRIAFIIDMPEVLVIDTKLTRFQMILDNLVSNAIKYADPGVAAPQVIIAGAFSAGGFLLTVSDNGLGIDPRDRTSLFQMFKRLHPGHAFGSGLGLYIVRKSAENMGGTVAHQALDKGSRFIVRLPQRAGP